MLAYTTINDVINHAFDYLGDNLSEQVPRDCVRAALDENRDIANALIWSYLYSHSRVSTNGALDGPQRTTNKPRSKHRGFGEGGRLAGTT